MNATAEKYIAGLKQAYADQNGQEIWNALDAVKHGVAEADLNALTKAYPDVPEALISLLRYVDGTYWREYAGKQVAFYFLGSDIEGYPYYLLSAKEITEESTEKEPWYTDYVRRDYEDIPVDDKITRDPTALRWLHFSDCMNNGGTSQLFIDFSPSASGTAGQVVRFVHDPDELKIIASSFEEYLEKLMANGYDFIEEETLE